MSDSKERLDYAGLSRFKDNLLDDVYAHVYKKSEAFDNIKSEIFDTVYPVGSIYMSINGTSPADLFGGEWEQIKDTFLLAAGDTYTNGETGGEATHTLSVSEMPSHSHSISSHSHTIPSLSGTAANAGSHSHTVGAHSHSIASFSVNTNSAGGHTHSVYTRAYYIGNNVDNPLELLRVNGENTYSSVMATAGSHSHSISIGSRYTASASTSTGSIAAHSHTVTTTSSATGSTTATMTTTGSGDAHNNMPPYLTVYMWQRVA